MSEVNRATQALPIYGNCSRLWAYSACCRCGLRKLTVVFRRPQQHDKKGARMSTSE